MKQKLFALALAAAMALPLFTAVAPDADAHRGRYYRGAQGRYYAPPPGYYDAPVAYYRDGVPFFRTKAGKIVKGSLIGAGIGAVAGAAIQAVRYSGW